MEEKTMNLQQRIIYKAHTAPTLRLKNTILYNAFASPSGSKCIIQKRLSLICTKNIINMKNTFSKLKLLWPKKQHI